MADHLSRLEAKKTDGAELEINDSFSDEQILAATIDLIPWYSNFDNYLFRDIMLEDLMFQQRKKFLHDIGKYY